ncbi:MAG: crossover junction endodeoxyribonuclease RuvC [Candidatus Firestonebacteria bacterium]
MIILGIDPGTATTGYGVIESTNNKFKLCEYGVIKTLPDLPLPLRLKKIYDNIKKLIKKYKPEIMAIEELFFSQNVKTAMSVSCARGVIMLAAANSGIDVEEYTPIQVKQNIVGYGRAEKRQIQEMVKILLNLKEIPEPDDAADALALAICGTNTRKI